ncbi:Proteoglycan 4 [Merluccius polli]|uniref:Proteoglycan 4 n=1 Tax=Merluccius polli TaxID=89951 RepID=A0AA47NRF8_MERPO|nr:Proteoglycan 4 [Merluccius polli]
MDENEAQSQAQPSEPTEAENQSKEDKNQTNVQMENPAAVLKKRAIKMTPKAYLEKLDKLQKERKSKLNKATNLQKHILGLMNAGESKHKVQCEFMKYIHVIREATGAHDALLSILPSEDKERHITWFKAKMLNVNDFIEEVNAWTSPMMSESVEGVTEEVHRSHSRSGSSRSSRSSTSSARRQAEAERAALAIQAAALKEKHAVEEEEEKLRKKKEMIELNAQLAAADAKIAVLKSPSHSVSLEPSDRMEQYFERGTSVQQSSITLNPSLPEQHQQQPLLLQQQQQPLLSQQQQPLLLQQQQPLLSQQQQPLLLQQQQPLLSQQQQPLLSHQQQPLLSQQQQPLLSQQQQPLLLQQQQPLLSQQQQPLLSQQQQPLLLQQQQPLLSQQQQPLLLQQQQPLLSQQQQPLLLQQQQPLLSQQQQPLLLQQQQPLLSQQQQPLLLQQQQPLLLQQQSPSQQPSAIRQRIFWNEAQDNSRHMNPPVQFTNRPDSSAQSNIETAAICDLLHRQNEITALLVEQQTSHLLPPREVPCFEGDPLQFRSFVRAFVHCVERNTRNKGDCLYFLEKYTKGQPKDLVRSCQHMAPDRGYERAKYLLEQHFGDEYKISAAYMEKVLSWSLVKTEDIKSLQAYSLFLRECCNAMENVQYMDELNVPANMKTIISKLPFKLREHWRGSACAIMERQHRRPNFTDIVAFVEHIQYAPPNTGSRPVIRVKAQSKPKFKGDSFATITTVETPAVENQTSSKPAPKPTNASAHNTTTCVCCSKDHTLNRCPQFATQTHRDKVTLIRQRGVCFGCLCVGHLSRNCDKRLICKVCSQKHPSVLHRERASNPDNPKKPVVSNAPISLQTCGQTGAGSNAGILPILPVQVKSSKGDKIIKTYAFLDPGSTDTFCSESLMKRLKLNGRKAKISLLTMGPKTSVSSYMLTDLEIASLTGEQFYELPKVYTQKRMPVSPNNIIKEEELAKWPYMEGVVLPRIQADVELLIGTNASKMLEPWEVVNSHGNGPHAIKTLLGWVVNGPLSGHDEEQSERSHPAVNVNRISISKLEELLHNQYNHDFNERSSEDKEELSRDDLKFMEIMTESCKLQDSHYTFALPFKRKDVSLPNNQCVAKQRILGLKRRFGRDEKFHREYTNSLGDVISKGYAELVPEHEIERSDGKVWYIPHHGVYHPKKGTLRVVFDCGAGYRGKSLNKELLQGPYLTSTLLGVLTRFRQEPVALMTDVKAMFHQVNVAQKDRDFLRFLWWPDGDVSQELVEYRMAVHLFGAVSSPSCACHALRKIAEDHRDSFPAGVIDTVSRNFYMDDCLKSLPSEEAAVKMVKDLTDICQKGGFHLTKWISNNRGVLLSIPEEDRSKNLHELDLDRDQLPVERALGLHWCVETDTFKFKLALKEQPHTRRGILSTVSSIYDPLGFLAPLTLPAKLMLQDMCRRNYGWDDEIHPALKQQWAKWLRDLEGVKAFEVERCLKPVDFGETICGQLHHFSDASESGYGTVTYLKIWDNSNKCHDLDIVADDPEVKKELVTNAVVVIAPSATHQLITYFSDWKKLKRSVAWILKLKTTLLEMSRKRNQLSHKAADKVEQEMKGWKAAHGNQSLTPDDLMRAETAIIYFAQQQRYPEELAALNSGKGEIKRESSIYKLDPIVKDGLLRVGGRLSRAAISEEFKHPVILAKDLHIATLILKNIHEQLGHGGRNHVLSRLRIKYWITSANAAARKILSDCVICRRHRGKLGEQKMSDLPLERIVADLPPFTNVGVDYFGPFEIKRGRSFEKRYGVLCTCMASRAVHLEVAYSLNTDSCINAIRRFVCRRGPISHLRSDNGTNFIGAKRELKDALAALNHSKIQSAFLEDGMQWSFNPPAASHHGGAWERIIRMIRQILTSVLHQQTLNDESFHTVLCEVEAILNDRPITKISGDHNDLEALTPNHILTMKGVPVLPPGLFETSDLYLRRRWRQVQYLSDLFWKRWLREYLPLLQERQRWAKERRSLVPGDIVLIADPSAPRGSWLLGRVLETYPDRRGLVRSARVKTKTSTLDRPVTKLCLLQEAGASDL